MRGKVRHMPLPFLQDRITPAYAGKSTPVQDCSCKHEDHPRLCGEKNSTTGNERRLVGSPPPMRGKDDEGTATKDKVGITPAYAGKRAICRDVRAVPRDHPRLCGEKVKTNGKSATEKGSPPPMRGKALMLNYEVLRNRITPAYAGKSVLQ